MKKQLSLLILSMILLSACSVMSNGNWHDSKNKAIEEGIKEEEISKEDIIDEIVVGDETFILFLRGSDTIGVANLANKNNEYIWYRANAFTKLTKIDSVVSWEVESESKDTYIIYAGIYDDKIPTIDTAAGKNSPFTNEEKGIFYYMENK